MRRATSAKTDGSPVKKSTSVFTSHQHPATTTPSNAIELARATQSFPRRLYHTPPGHNGLHILGVQADPEDLGLDQSCDLVEFFEIRTTTTG